MHKRSSSTTTQDMQKEGRRHSKDISTEKRAKEDRKSGQLDQDEAKHAMEGRRNSKSSADGDNKGLSTEGRRNSKSSADGDNKRHSKHGRKDSKVSQDGDKYFKETLEFHKKFDVPRSETVVTYFACSHKGKVLKPGRIFITPSYIGFHAQLFGKSHKKLISFSEISDITKQNYGMLPNAIKITTTNKKEMLFASFVHRDTAFDALMAQWCTLKKPAPVTTQDGDGESDDNTDKNDKNGIEMHRISPNHSEKNKSSPRGSETNNSNHYEKYDITSKKSHPNSIQSHSDNGASPSSPVSLADRAQILLEKGAIVAEDNTDPTNISRPTSQQDMLPSDDTKSQTCLPTASKAPKKRYCCF